MSRFPLSRTLARSLSASLLWVAALATAAEPPAPAHGAGLEYRSAFERYNRFEDPPSRSWREANDTVGRIGGWRAYAREAHAGPPDGDAAAPRAPADAAVADSDRRLPAAGSSLRGHSPPGAPR